MKIFFWLLIAVNVILFAVMQTGMMDGREVVQVPPPLHEEKITIAVQSAPVSIAPLISAQPASAPLSAPVAAKASTCFEWGEFSGAELERASQSLSKLSLGGKLSQREIDRVIGYWVYILPLRDKAAVNQKVAQLKARGVTEYFVVQEAGEWLNAISLGLFKSREAAQHFLEGLRNKGVNSAKMGERSSKSRAIVFVIDGLDAQTSGKLTVLQKDFSGSELKSVSCH